MGNIAAGITDTYARRRARFRERLEVLRGYLKGKPEPDRTLWAEMIDALEELLGGLGHQPQGLPFPVP